jgi:DNA polymerase III gamma/tau subunit
LCVESRSSPGSGFIVAPAAVLKEHGLAAEASARAILECPQGSQIILPDNALKEILRGEGVDSASERQLKQRQQEQTGARLREETARAAEAAKAEAARREAEELRRQQQEERKQQEEREEEQRRQQQEHRQQQAAERAAAAEAAKREREQQERERAAAALAAALKQQQERELKQQLEREAEAAAKAAEERRRDELEIARAKEENRKREEEKKARAAADAAAAAAVLPTAAGLAAAKASPVTLTFTLEEDFDALCSNASELERLREAIVRDLATSLHANAARFQILDIKRGSIIVTIVIVPDPLAQDPRTSSQLAAQMTALAKDATSLLRIKPSLRNLTNIQTPDGQGMNVGLRASTSGNTSGNSPNTSNQSHLAGLGIRVCPSTEMR